MCFKDISYFELWRPFCSGERNHLCNFGRRHHKEQFCEIILNLDQWFKEFFCLFDLVLYVHSTIFQLCGTCLPGLNQY